MPDWAATSKPVSSSRRATPSPKEDRVVGEDDAHPVPARACSGAAKSTGRSARAAGEARASGARAARALELLHLAFDLRDRVGREDDLARRGSPRRCATPGGRRCRRSRPRRSSACRVDPHPDTHGGVVGPVVGAQRPLGRDRGAHGLGGVLEDGEQLVSVRVDLVAALLLGRRPDQPAHVREGASVGVAEPLDEAGQPSMSLKRKLILPVGRCGIYAEECRRARRSADAERNLGADTGSAPGRADDAEPPSRAATRSAAREGPCRDGSAPPIPLSETSTTARPFVCSTSTDTCDAPTYFATFARPPRRRSTRPPRPAPASAPR